MHAFLRILAVSCIITVWAAAIWAQTSAYFPLGPGVAVEEASVGPPHVQMVGVACLVCTAS